MHLSLVPYLFEEIDLTDIKGIYRNIYFYKVIASEARQSHTTN
jgi:hypothetical protein